MFLNKLLEDIIKVDTKKIYNMSDNPNRWWNEPEDNVRYYDLKSKGYVSMNVFTVCCSILFAIFSIIYYINNNSIFLIWASLTVLGVLFSISFYTLAKKTNKDSINEETAFNNAINNKYAIDSLLIRFVEDKKKDLEQNLVETLKTNTNLFELEDIFFNMISGINEFQRELEDLYQQHKVYNYNINEPMEVEAYSKVDSFKTYEEMSDHLNEVLKICYNCKQIVETNNEDENLLVLIEELLDVLKVGLGEFTDEGGM